VQGRKFIFNQFKENMAMIKDMWNRFSNFYDWTQTLSGEYFLYYLNVINIFGQNYIK
jgi:hypothetical protein